MTNQIPLTQGSHQTSGSFVPPYQSMVEPVCHPRFTDAMAVTTQTTFTQWSQQMPGSVVSIIGPVCQTSATEPGALTTPTPLTQENHQMSSNVVSPYQSIITPLCQTGATEPRALTTHTPLKQPVCQTGVTEPEALTTQTPLPQETHQISSSVVSPYQSIIVPVCQTGVTEPEALTTQLGSIVSIVGPVDQTGATHPGALTTQMPLKQENHQMSGSIVSSYQSSVGPVCQTAATEPGDLTTQMPLTPENHQMSGVTGSGASPPETLSSTSGSPQVSAVCGWACWIILDTFTHSYVPSTTSIHMSMSMGVFLYTFMHMLSLIVDIYFNPFTPTFSMLNVILHISHT